MKEFAKKSATFENPINGQRWFCPNIQEIEVIDGVEYLYVQQPGTLRVVKMRKDVLKKVTTFR